MRWLCRRRCQKLTRIHPAGAVRESRGWLCRAHWIDKVEDKQGAGENGGLELAQSAVDILRRQAAERERREHMLAEQKHHA